MDSASEKEARAKPAVTRQRFDYPERPTVLEALSFDFASVPAASALSAGASTRFSLVGSWTNVRASVMADLAGEIDIGRCHFPAVPAASVPDEFVKPAQDTSVKPPACFSTTERAVTLVGCGREQLDDMSIRCRIATGSFDPVSLRGSITKDASVVGQAIVPNMLYAFRWCTAGCDGKTRRAEELVIVTPSARWRVLTTRPDEPMAAAAGAFSVSRLRVEEGKTGSMLAHVDWRHLARFIALQHVTPDWTEGALVKGEVLQVAVDVDWLTGGDPRGFATVSKVTLFAKHLFDGLSNRTEDVLPYDLGR